MTILVAAPNAAFESKTVVGKSDMKFTFMHLADTLIQTSIAVKVHILSVHVLLGN